MNDSKVGTIAVPLITGAPVSLRGGSAGSGESGIIIAQANKVPLRVVLRNNSFGATVFVAHGAQSVQQLPMASDVYELPPGTSETFVLAPDQKLFAGSTGANARCSFAISDALPIDIKPA